MFLFVPRGWSVECECVRSKGKLSPESCGGLGVINPDGDQVGVFRGHRVEAIESHDGVITIFERLGSNDPMASVATKADHPR